MGMDPELRSDRIALLLVLEMRRIVRHLRIRRAMLVKTWSRFRAREPFLETMFSRWRTLGFHDLAMLPTEVHGPLEGFFDELDDFRYYVSFTDDMPATLDEQYEVSLERIEEAARVAIESLGYALDDADEASPPVAELITMAPRDRAD